MNKSWNERLMMNRSPPPSPVSKRKLAAEKEMKPDLGKQEKKFRKPVPGKLPGDDYCGWDENINDYSCDICESAMNSEHTFMMHLGGKRHQKKLSVARLTDEVRTEFPRHANMQEIRVGGEHKVLATKQVKKPPKVQPVFDKEKQPIIGLQYVTEILRQDKKQDPVYHCTLCPADCQLSSIVGHITGLKHRLAYMKMHYPDIYLRVNNASGKRSSMSDSAEYYAEFIERKDGRGEMFVEEELDSKDLEIMEAMPLTDEEINFTRESIFEWPAKDRTDFLLYALDSIFEDHLEANILNEENIQFIRNASKKIKAMNLSEIHKLIDEDLEKNVTRSLMEGDQSVVKGLIQSPVVEVGEPTREVFRRLLQRGESFLN